MQVYLDNSATTKVSRPVLSRVTEAMIVDYGNPSSLHTMGMEAEQYIKKAERKLNENTIIFWILWGLLTVGMIIGFYALENKWLY